VVFSEGVAGTAFYVVISGVVAVTVKGIPVGQLESLSGFGELALVNDAPRKATITSSTNSALLRIEKMQFLNAIKKKNEPDVKSTAGVVDSKSTTFSLTEVPEKSAEQKFQDWKKEKKQKQVQAMLQETVSAGLKSKRDQMILMQHTGIRAVAPHASGKKCKLCRAVWPPSDVQHWVTSSLLNAAFESMKRRNIILPLFQVKTVDASGVARLQICSCCYSILQQEQNLSRQELQFSRCLLHEAAAFSVNLSASVGTSRPTSSFLNLTESKDANNDDNYSDDDDMYSWNAVASGSAPRNTSPSRGGAMRLSSDVVQQAMKVASGSVGPSDHRLSPSHSKVITRLRTSLVAHQAIPADSHVCCLFIEPTLLRSFNSLVSVDSTEVYTIKYSLLNCPNFFTFMFQKESTECAGGVGCHWYLSQAQQATLFCRNERIVFTLISGDGRELGTQSISLAPLSQSMVLVHEFVGKFDSHGRSSPKHTSVRRLSHDVSPSPTHSPGSSESPTSHRSGSPSRLAAAASVELLPLSASHELLAFKMRIGIIVTSPIQIDHKLGVKMKGHSGNIQMPSRPFITRNFPPDNWSPFNESVLQSQAGIMAKAAAEQRKLLTLQRSARSKQRPVTAPEVVLEQSAPSPTVSQIPMILQAIMGSVTRSAYYIESENMLKKLLNNIDDQRVHWKRMDASGNGICSKLELFAYFKSYFPAFQSVELLNCAWTATADSGTENISIDMFGMFLSSLLDCGEAMLVFSKLTGDPESVQKLTFSEFKVSAARLRMNASDDALGLIFDERVAKFL
jgi:hypothetical protein